MQLHNEIATTNTATQHHWVCILCLAVIRFRVDFDSLLFPAALVACPIHRAGSGALYTGSISPLSERGRQKAWQGVSFFFQGWGGGGGGEGRAWIRSSPGTSGGQPWWGT